MNQNSEVNSSGFDMDKLKALPHWKAEDELTSVAAIAAFAAEFAEMAPDEMRAALTIISKVKPTEERIDEAAMTFLCDQTNLNQDGVEEYSMQMAVLLNKVALRPVPGEELQEYLVATTPAN